MQTDSWTDITKQIFTQSKKFKFLGSICQKQYSLEDSMQAHQINDPKIDPKFDLSAEDTFKQLLQKGKIAKPQTLTFQQIRLIFRRIMLLQNSILIGNPLPQTIYTFSYLFDKKICENNEESIGCFSMKCLIESINILGSYIYLLLKQSCQTKEDDIGISTFSFNTEHGSNEQLLEMFLKLQKRLEAESKASKPKIKIETKQEQNFINQIVSYVRVRRSLHNLIKSLGSGFDVKNTKKILEDISAVRKKLTALSQITKNEQQDTKKSQQLLKTVFNQRIHKTLRTNFSPRKTEVITLQRAIQAIENTFFQIELFVPPPTKTSQWKNKMQILQDQPLNLWSKSYIKVSLLMKQNYLFNNSVKSEDALISDIDDWISLRQNTRKQEKFKQLIQNSSGVVVQTIYRLLGNSMRWQWQISKIYQDYNYLIYMANSLDGQISPKKQLYVCSWFYYYGIGIMIRQVFTGFKIKMYEKSEYPYVLYFLEQLLNIFDKNAQYFIKKMDKQYIQAFVDETLVHKRKKKFDGNVRKMFTETQFRKAQHYYIRGLHRLIAVLLAKQLFTNPFEQKLELRAKNRFRIFKNVAFLRKFDFQQYKKTMQHLQSNINQSLEQASQLLKEAKLVFQKITKLEESDCYYNQLKDSQFLMKASVQASLAVMSLKFNQKKTYSLEAAQGSCYLELKAV